MISIINNSIINNVEDILFIKMNEFVLLLLLIYIK